MGRNKKKCKDSDYKGRKSQRFTKKDYVPPANADKLLKLEEYQVRDEKKNRSHPTDTLDEHTGLLEDLL